MRRRLTLLEGAWAFLGLSGSFRFGFLRPQRVFIAAPNFHCKVHLQPIKTRKQEEEEEAGVQELGLDTVMVMRWRFGWLCVWAPVKQSRCLGLGNSINQQNCSTLTTKGNLVHKFNGQDFFLRAGLYSPAVVGTATYKSPNFISRQILVFNFWGGTWEPDTFCTSTVGSPSSFKNKIKYKI